VADRSLGQLELGIGRFGWATDPEGNRFELWQPAAEGS
jgi:predicted enzyme related to lactoylglutathione lyase